MRDEREKQRDQEMLERLWASDTELTPTMAAAGLKLWDLSRWARKKANREMAQGLQIWADMGTQLMLSRYRSTAVAKLLELARTAKDETARKACVDALKLNPFPLAKGEPGGPGVVWVEPYDEDELRRALNDYRPEVFEALFDATRYVSEPLTRKRISQMAQEEASQ